MDGWSAPILVRELLEAYAQGGSTASLPRVTPYREYLSLIARQDRDTALAAWRESLAGLEEGTRLSPRAADRDPIAPEQIVLALDGTLSAALNRAARERAVTLNTVMQTAWGILLGRLTGRDDVVFGVTVAGRPAELAGVEHMVGLFINTLPLRMALPQQLPLSDLLRQTQDRQSQLMAHQHVGLAEIQQAAGWANRSTRLARAIRRPRGLAARGRPPARPGPGHDATHYPLALIVQPGKRTQLRSMRPTCSTRHVEGARLIRLLEWRGRRSDRALGVVDLTPSATPSRLWSILRRWRWGHPRRPCRRCLPRRRSARRTPPR
jgi:hypothetical protein